MTILEKGDKTMWLRHTALGISGFCAGVAVSAGTFAFLLVIGVLPRMMYKANVREKVLLIENLTVLGVLYGAVKSVFEWNMTIPGGHLIAGIFGISAGIFVGGIAAALAEILHTFPIMFRRLHIKEGLPWVMAAMAAGKLLGSLFYFMFGYAFTA
jgi:stage V sporulation protein AB